LDDLPLVQQAQLEAQAAQFRLRQRERDQYPSVFARLQDTRASGRTASGSALSIGLRYSPGAGWSSLATARAAVARAEGAQAAVEAARRDVQDAVRAEDEDQRSAAERVSLLQAAVDRSAAVLDSYQRQFTAGRKSWQEVLDATRELYQNRIAHADAQAQAQVGAYRLRLRLRSHPWQTAAMP
jgi:adhesin transport system outer membrane protein